MTEPRSPDNRIRAWLELMPDSAPDRVIDAVLHAAATTPQVRPSLATAWRSSRMNRITQLAAAALLGAALVGGAVLLAGNRTNQPSPSSSPLASQGSSAGGVETALFGTWVTFVEEMPSIGNGSGPIRLTISGIGTPNLAIDNLQPGARFGSVLESVGADQLKVTVNEPDSYCLDAGVEATYQWRLSDDRSQLTLTSAGDPCTARALALGRTWVRSLIGSTRIGAGIVDAFEPFFSVVLPDASYGARSLNDWVSIESSNHVSLSAWKNPVGFADPCEQTRVPYVPGAAAIVAHLEANRYLTISDKATTTVAGLPATHLTVQGGDSPCDDGSILLFTPVDCDCHWVTAKDVFDSFYVVDVDGDTFIFAFSAGESGASEASVIDSIRIPAEYPAP